MKLLSEKAFLDLLEDEFPRFALERDAVMTIPHAYLDGVVENLKILQNHARVVAAALPVRSSPAPETVAEAFEP